MSTGLFRVFGSPSRIRRLGSALAATTLVIVATAPAYAEVAQSPLYLGGGNVPGNLTLVPSVEWPTINSVANLGETYDERRTYVGYFDSGKCYEYHYSSTEANRHFYPTRRTNDHRCTGSDEWSGASERRPGGTPPLRVISDGTVF